jgi:serine/threonine protein kinase
MASPTVFTRIKASDVVYRQRSTPKRLNHGRYLVGGVIGQGSYAKVREAWDMTSRRTVALKIFTPRYLRRVPGGEVSMRRELWALRKLPPHPNVISMVDHWSDEAKGKNYLAIDLVPGGTLRDLIDRAPGNRVPVGQARALFRCLVAGLAHMHGHGVYHRDIKTDNLMLQTDAVLRITDFGTAVPDAATEGVGAPAFQPPEVARDGKAPSSAKLDVWAAGVTLYIMATGRYPFEETGTVYQLFEDIAKCEYDVPAHLSEPLAGLLRGMLCPDPSRRLSLDQIVRHPWFSLPDDVGTEPPPIRVVPLRTLFTEENVSRFLKDVSGGDRFSFISGDQLDPIEEEIDDGNLRVEKPGFWCGLHCLVL